MSKPERAYPGHPTVMQAAIVREKLKTGQPVTSQELREEGINPGQAISALRHISGTPIATGFTLVEIDQRDLFGIDAANDDGDDENEDEASAGRECMRKYYYLITADELERGEIEPEEQAEDYLTLIAQNKAKRGARQCMNYLIQNGYDVPEAIRAAAEMEIPPVTAGTSRLPEHFKKDEI